MASPPADTPPNDASPPLRAGWRPPMATTGSPSVGPVRGRGLTCPGMLRPPLSQASHGTQAALPPVRSGITAPPSDFLLIQSWD